MNFAAFITSLKKVEKILKREGILKQSLLNRAHNVSQEFLDAVHKKNYINMYKAAIKNADYQFLMFDDSIMQFFHSPMGLESSARYAFYQRPYKFPTYDDYLKSLGFSYEECGEFFYSDYEQEVSESELNLGALTIRYDYSEKGYIPGKHSVSHIHIGTGNEMRLSVSHKLTPETFVMFVLKNAFYHRWIDLMGGSEFSNEFNLCKRKIYQLGKNYFRDIDKKELYLA